MKRKIEALKATGEVSPIVVKKKIEAPSRIPSSPNEMGGIMVLTNIIRFPTHRKLSKL